MRLCYSSPNCPHDCPVQNPEVRRKEQDMTDTRIAVQIDPERVKRERAYFEDELQRVELAKVLPKGMTPEAFIRIVLTTHTKVPKLWNTTLKSRWLAICEAAALGLPLDGRMAA